MREYRIVLTQEAVYDVVDIADYIECSFGEKMADRFQITLKKQLENLKFLGNVFSCTQIYYRGFAIYKKSFSPSIIFYIIKESKDEIHILRILREESDWESILSSQQKYTY